MNLKRTIFGLLIIVLLVNLVLLLLRSQNDIVEPEVIFLSFPKCGRTWLRWMVSYAIAEDALTVGSITSFPTLPELMQGNFARVLSNQRSYRIPTYVFSHSLDDSHPFLLSADEVEDHASSGLLLNKSIILLVRDPRDVVVSAYYETKYRYAPGKTPSSLEDFICGDVGGYRTVVALYRFWARVIPAQARRWLVVKYEDLHSNATQVIKDVFEDSSSELTLLQELRRVFEFMGLKEHISERSIDLAVAAGSFEVMKWIEQRNSHYRARRPLPKAPAFIPSRIASITPERIDSFSMYDIDEPNSAKMRSGAIGSYQSVLEKHPRVARLFRELPCNCSFY